MSIAAQAGDVMLGFANLGVIAKRLVSKLRMAIVMTGENFLIHDEVGPDGSRVQGEVMYAGQFVLWIIHKFTLSQYPSMNANEWAVLMQEWPLAAQTTDMIQGGQFSAETEVQLTAKPPWSEFKFEQKGPNTPKPMIFHSCITSEDAHGKM